jgi:hypothetical protein
MQRQLLSRASIVARYNLARRALVRQQHPLHIPELPPPPPLQLPPLSRPFRLILLRLE